MIAFARSNRKPHEVTITSGRDVKEVKIVIPVFDESWFDTTNEQTHPENQTNRVKLAIKKIYDSLRTMAYNLFG